MPKRACTFTKAVALNVIAPMAKFELAKDLAGANFVTTSMDASNQKNVKMMPFIIRCYIPDQGVQVKFLYVHSVPYETSEILT